MKSLRRFASVFAFSLAIQAGAGASVLDFKPGDASIEEVKLSREAVLTLPDSDAKSVSLKPYVKGLRKKKVALFWAKVYVGQIFSSTALSPPKSIAEAYDALSKQPTVAITLTFVRHVTADQMKSAFEDSFETNGIDSKNDPGLKPLFDILKKAGDIYDKQTLAIILTKGTAGSEMLYLENGKGELQSTKAEKGTQAKILKLWVGKPADSGMERLHEQFLGKSE